jgi:hypothetical protein
LKEKKESEGSAMSTVGNPTIDVPFPFLFFFSHYRLLGCVKCVNNANQG